MIRLRNKIHRLRLLILFKQNNLLQYSIVLFARNLKPNRLKNNNSLCIAVHQFMLHQNQLKKENSYLEKIRFIFLGQLQAGSNHAAIIQNECGNTKQKWRLTHCSEPIKGNSSTPLPLTESSLFCSHYLDHPIFQKEQ